MNACEFLFLALSVSLYLFFYRNKFCLDILSSEVCVYICLETIVNWASNKYHLNSFIRKEEKKNTEDETEKKRIHISENLCWVASFCVFNMKWMWCPIIKFFVQVSSAYLSPFCTIWH